MDVAVATPSVGVTNVGLVANAIPPEPVTFWPKAPATPVPNAVIPVPPLATLNVPVVPLTIGNPVQFVNVPDCGTPRIGVTKVGLFKVGVTKVELVNNVPTVILRVVVPC